MKIKKYDIILVNLNPTCGSEQKGIRPCLVVQNNEANKYSKTTTICIISSIVKKYPHTLIIQPSDCNGLLQISRIDLLQIRTIDKSRIIRKLGTLDKKYKNEFKQKFIISFDLEDLLF